MPDPDTARALAARLAAGAWQLDADPDAPADAGADAAPDPDPDPDPVPPPDPDRARLFPRAVAGADAPPGLDRIVEALLFAGGPPLTPAAAAQAVRGLTPDRLRDLVAGLNARYRGQNRPYSVAPQAGGYVLAVRPAYGRVRDKLVAGPREARLGQPALDVLSVVAYRQPVAKPDVDAVRGADSAGPLRQLVRLGLVTLTPPAAGAGGGYATTARFLSLMGLDSLADLPKLGTPKAHDGGPL